MKLKTVFCCEFCDAAPFETLGAAQEHEAGHFSLTVDDYKAWGRLIREAENTGKSVGCASNPQTRKAFDSAVRALVNFEAGHGISTDTHEPRYFG